MPFAGYKDFTACVKANSDKGDPHAYCATIMHQAEGSAVADFRGSKLTADFGFNQLYQKGSKKYLKAFLISEAANLKSWQVTPESIPQRIRTFIGRPYISEPQLEHFGADFMPVQQILDQQEKYRAGTIIDVQYNSKTGTAHAIIEITDNQVWQELQSGKAIYVSPAVAGFSVLGNGLRTFVDWFGLHLARVAKPAYGVMHASITKTCEGSEKECVDMLVASASLHLVENSENGSFNIGNVTPPCKMQPAGQPTEPTLKDIAKGLADITTKITNFETELNTLKAASAMGGKNSTAITDPLAENEKQRGQSGEAGTAPNKGLSSTGTGMFGKHGTDEDEDEEKKKGAASAADRIKELETKVAAYDLKEKNALIDHYMGMQASAGIVDKNNEKETREKLSKLTTTEIEARIDENGPLLQKLAESGGHLPDEFTPERAVSSVASASGSSGHQFTSVEDIRNKLELIS